MQRRLRVSKLRLVAVHPGDLHAAIPFAVLDVAAPEEDQVVFEFGDVGEECHPGLRFCAGDVQGIMKIFIHVKQLLNREFESRRGAPQVSLSENPSSGAIARCDNSNSWQTTSRSSTTWP
jgi:hypothetical protein